MKKIKLFKPTSNDLQDMLDIWHDTFDYKDVNLFFEHFYNQELSLVSRYNGKVVSMGHLLPVGNFVTDEGSTIPTAMIYAVATLHEYRKHGMGSAISNALIQVARNNGYPAVVLRPAQDSLFDFYSMKTDMKEWFYVTKYKLKSSFATQYLPVLSEISTNKYKELRDKLLKDTPHIRLNLHSVVYQKGLCELFGGGLFQINSPHGDSCAIIERDSDDLVYVKELLVPGVMYKSEDYYLFLQSITAAAISTFPAKECIIRAPVINSHFTHSGANIESSTERFAMLSLPPNLQNIAKCTSKQAWYGLAFD